MHVTIWNEHRIERASEEVAERYPDGMHAALAAAVREHTGAQVATATLDDEDHGLPSPRLEETDVLVWWGHRAHDEVPQALVDRIQRQVLDGMGFVALHSAHLSRPFLRLMGTSGMLRWQHGVTERLWLVDPAHPIAAGLPEVIQLDEEEMYGEPFDVPAPHDLVAISSFSSGEVFRSVCTWRRGRGRIVYLRPGDENYPTYHDPRVRRLVANAVAWAGRPT